MDFRGLLELLAGRGMLEVLSRPISSHLEAARFIRSIDGPCLLEDCDGHRVVSNVLSTRDILCTALGCTKEGFVSLLSRPAHGRLVCVEHSPTLEVEERVQLDELPILQHFKNDGGRYITGGVVFSEYDGMSNASIHRIQVLDDVRGAIRLVAPRHTYLLHRRAAENGDDLPIAVCIGVDPHVMVAACTRVGMGEELRYASALAGEPVEVFECENGVKVPHCEMVLTGYISKDEVVDEGPFVDVTGTYDIVRPQPVVRFERMYCREDAIYHAIMPAGKEHRLLMGIPYEPKLFRAVSEVAKVKNVVMSEGGCCYLHAVVQIDKQTEGDGKNAALAALAAHGSLKHVVVVDEDIDIFDPTDVEYAIATRVRADRDVFIITHVRGSSLDPTCDEDGTTTKVGIDATCPLCERDKYWRITG
ncbi:UbiD family decarboxylase [Methermicoccus shengliensis]|uniref:Anhydromevalonate phosphate decarboxylase n=1 Tax=Methermicoccus shengliensis TaxID=660064 RepID=A0A832RXD7_9EURY|nr:UbiD family decarboxylase [Methermicoccus shengliensis]KUK03970.1 MAG: 4-hydroxybenzoate decarboxylase [Euryarchaeota archaeon 55_53]KUK29639.1 MAG: 4-hydroxybenzoate decarboxylase [Methanosarcinales archeaon 56_1174]MDI3488686.1 trans-anhydromevalonate 5-phosphate decarboxylase [Methanosarcinales archaeon]MDN5294765.1 trans-anhydromevalonate 5-phosphate decarboxylase [Methanosarcinales archaeon]HIH69479.1 UbiD family decarboxylase [Methermicoccus shengliensis]